MSAPEVSCSMDGGGECSHSNAAAPPLSDRSARRVAVSQTPSPSLSLRDFPRLLAGRQAVIFAAQQEAAGWIDVDGCCGIVPYPFIFSLSCEYIRALVFEKEQRFRRRLKMQWQF